MKNLILILSLVGMIGCASAPPKKDNRYDKLMDELTAIEKIQSEQAAGLLSVVEKLDQALKVQKEMREEAAAGRIRAEGGIHPICRVPDESDLKKTEEKPVDINSSDLEMAPE
jgi:hypothetical protein